MHTDIYRLTIISRYSKERNSSLFKEFDIYILSDNECFNKLSNKSNIYAQKSMCSIVLENQGF